MSCHRQEQLKVPRAAFWFTEGSSTARKDRLDTDLLELGGARVAVARS